MSHHARAHSWRAAYSATLAIAATTPTNMRKREDSEEASKGHLLGRRTDRRTDGRQPYFSQQTTATSAELESASLEKGGVRTQA